MTTPALTALRWLARISSLISLATLAAFLGPGESGTPAGIEWLALAAFPGGVALGMLLGWWRERAGGLLTLASLVTFYLILGLAAGRWPTGPYFLILAAPGLLFLIVGLLSRR